MKKTFLIVLILAAQSSFAQYIGTYDLTSMGIEFAAPVVGSRTALTNVPAGQIVYEHETGFWGLTTSGGPGTASNWTQLSLASGNLVGSGGTENVERLRVATVCTSSPCTITSQSGAWMTSITRSSTGRYTLNIAPGTFSDVPSCVMQNISSGSSSRLYSAIDCGTSSTTCNVVTDNSSALASDANFMLICMGPR